MHVSFADSEFIVSPQLSSESDDGDEDNFSSGMDSDFDDGCGKGKVRKVAVVSKGSETSKSTGRGRGKAGKLAPMSECSSAPVGRFV